MILANNIFAVIEEKANKMAKLIIKRQVYFFVSNVYQMQRYLNSTYAK